jgi:hypothetical protein
MRRWNLDSKPKRNRRKKQRNRDVAMRKSEIYRSMNVKESLERRHSDNKKRRKRREVNKSSLRSL